jgi:hypothetical protein
MRTSGRIFMAESRLLIGSLSFLIRVLRGSSPNPNYKKSQIPKRPPSVLLLAFCSSFYSTVDNDDSLFDCAQGRMDALVVAGLDYQSLSVTVLSSWSLPLQNLHSLHSY